MNEKEIKLRYGERGLCIAYYDLTLPVRIESYLEVLGHNISGIEQRFGGENAACTNYLGLINLFKSFKLAGSGTKGTSVRYGAGKKTSPCS